MIQRQPISTHSDEAPTTQILLRLLLFVIARTGLFLGVVAWVASQWWSLNGHVAVAGYGGGGQVLHPGIAVWVDSSIQSLGFKVQLARESDLHHSPFSPALQQELSTARDSSVGSQLPGVVLITAPFLGITVVTIRHWFVVVFFVALNGMLWFVYRQRKEAEPCEV